MEKELDKSSPSTTEPEPETLNGQDAPIIPREEVINSQKRHISTHTVEEPGIFGALPKYMIEEGERAVNETEEMIRKEYREVMRRLRKGNEPKGPNPYMPNHIPEGSSYRNSDQQETNTLNQENGQNGLSSPSPLPEPMTVRAAAPYDYPINSEGTFDQNYVSPSGQKPGWTMEPVPEEHLPQESTRHLYVDPNHKALKPRKVVLHQETSNHPSPWMFPAKDGDVTESTTNGIANESATAADSASPKWVMASSTTDPISDTRRTSETGSAFDMDSKTSTTSEASETTTTLGSDPVASNTIDGSSPSSSANERSSRSHVEGPIFREFIDGEMGLDGRCRCFVDPSVYFRR